MFYHCYISLGSLASFVAFNEGLFTFYTLILIRKDTNEATCNKYQINMNIDSESVQDNLT